MKKQRAIILVHQRTVWKRLRKNRMARLCFTVLLFLFLFAFFGPLLRDAHYAEQVRGMENLSPSFSHPFGTDNLGRDLLVRSMVGTRISLCVGIVASLIAMIIGSLYGAVSGFLGGRVDAFLMRIVDLVYSIPDVLLVMVLSTILRDPLTGTFQNPHSGMSMLFSALGPGVLAIFLSFGLLYWVGMARIVRGQILLLKKQEFVIAAQALGASTGRTIWKHLLPNCAGPILVTACLQVPTAIFLESFLSFLGLGVSAPMTSLGSMIADALNGLYSYPYRLLFPSLLLCILILCLNGIGEALEESFDPRASKNATFVKPFRLFHWKKVSEATTKILSREALVVRNLSILHHSATTPVTAAFEVSFSIQKGEILGLVGESGSGKSSCALALAGLLTEGTSTVIGSVQYFGEEWIGRSETELCKKRGKEVGMILQASRESLDPVFTIGFQMKEVLQSHGTHTAEEAERLVIDALARVGISEPQSRINQYPHELSGGMCQRVALATALLCHPKVIIADEPTTALDVTTQAQILEILVDLAKEEDLAVLFITNSLGVAATACDRIAVLYAGSIVEYADAKELFRNPMHPYTQALLRAIPNVETGRQERLCPIPGMMRDVDSQSVGCPFEPRCEHKRPICGTAKPTQTKIDSGHFVSCFRVSDHALLEEQR